jgi:peroxiredoxin
MHASFLYHSGESPMTYLRTSVFLVLSILASAAPRCASQKPSSPLQATDSDGHRLTLLGPNTKAAVLFFLAVDCPISNSYIPEMNRIAAEYKARNIAIYAVYTDPAVSIHAVHQHAQQFGLRVPLIADRTHDLVHRVGATVTPEVAVLDRRGKLVYLGRIDDLYVDFGKRRPAPTQRYLRKALDAVLSGSPVALPNVAPVGCAIYPN